MNPYYLEIFDLKTRKTGQRWPITGKPRAYIDTLRRGLYRRFCEFPGSFLIIIDSRSEASFGLKPRKAEVA